MCVSRGRRRPTGSTHKIEAGSIEDSDGDLVSSQAARARAISIAETGTPQGMTLALEWRSESDQTAAPHDE